MKFDNQQFEALVSSAWEKIPKHFKEEIENLNIVVEPNPTLEQLARLQVKGILLGLFEGTPKTGWGQAIMGVQPCKITIFRDSILLCVKNEEELHGKIKEVLMHEIGHYFGYNEEALFIMDQKLREQISNNSISSNS